MVTIYNTYFRITKDLTLLTQCNCVFRMIWAGRGRKHKRKKLLQDLDVNGRILKRDLKETGCENLDWVKLAQDREELLTVVDMLVNIRGHKMLTNS